MFSCKQRLSNFFSEISLVQIVKGCIVQFIWMHFVELMLAHSITFLQELSNWQSLQKFTEVFDHFTSYYTNTGLILLYNKQYRLVNFLFKALVPCFQIFLMFICHVFMALYLREECFDFPPK